MTKWKGKTRGGCPVKVLEAFTYYDFISDCDVTRIFGRARLIGECHWSAMSWREDGKFFDRPEESPLDLIPAEPTRAEIQRVIMKSISWPLFFEGADYLLAGRVLDALIEAGFIKEPEE